MSQQLLSQIDLATGVRRLGGFFAGLLIVLPLGWGLVYLAYTSADRFGVTKEMAAVVAAAVSLGVFLFAERGRWLSRLMGLEYHPATPAWMSAGAFWLLGPAWVVYKVLTYGSDPFAVKPKGPKPKKQPSGRDSVRESAETVVFVVVLMLLLKLFVVEAFVIPTGSMAETLYGYQKVVDCEQCGYRFPVNASREAEPQPGSSKSLTAGYCCPNCRFADPWGMCEKDPISGRVQPDNRTGGPKAKFDWTSGDRVLVGKFMGPDDRGRVVVFKFPDAPQTGQVAQNYIKRLVGFGGETMAVAGGDLYVTDGLKYDPKAMDEVGQPRFPEPTRELDGWRAPFHDQWGNGRWTGPDFRYPNAPHAVSLFERSREAGFTTPGGFQIVRKPDDQVLAMRRIVYDNEHQAKALVKAGASPRWAATDGWAVDTASAPKAFTHTGDALGWVRYRHLLPANTRDDNNPGWSSDPGELKPHLITNFLGYNAGYEAMPSPGGLSTPQQQNLTGGGHWCGDLLLETQVTLADPSAKFALELSKGTHRYRAEFDGGKVRLKMFPGEVDVKREDGNTVRQMNVVPIGEDSYTLDTRPSGITGGKHQIRFGNVDCRLRVWVDDTPIDFEGKADYAPPVAQFRDPNDKDGEGWMTANDINEPAGVAASGGVTVGKLKLWRDTYYTNVRDKLDTFYVQPGHYLCMGDNSAQSSDGRTWGVVPERLMLGRAAFVFWPFSRVGFIK
jgi:signal peptidase I